MATIRAATHSYTALARPWQKRIPDLPIDILPGASVTASTQLKLPASINFIAVHGVNRLSEPVEKIPFPRQAFSNLAHQL